MEANNYSNFPETTLQVLRLIFCNKEITRAELSNKLGLSNITISKIMTSLLSKELVVEIDNQVSTGGRKPQGLSLNAEYAFAIGIDIGSYSFKIGVVGIDGTLLESEVITTYQKEIPANTLTINEIEAKIEHLLKKYNHEKCLGIGVAVSGIVDYNNQTIVFCPNIANMGQDDIVARLQEKFKVPVSLDSSARCMALCEQYFGGYPNAQTQIHISIGYGISSGLIINSELFRGSDGFSGELGHIKVIDSQELCTCGNFGCLELYATVPMIVHQVKSLLSNFNVYSTLKQSIDDCSEITIEDIGIAFKTGDKSVCKVITATCELIGKALSSCINLLNPEIVVFGGGLVEAIPEIIPEIERYVKQNSLTPSVRNIKITKSAIVERSAIIGSAMQIILKFLSLH